MRFTRNSALGILVLAFCAAQTAQAADAFFDTTHFSGSGNCANCHNGLFDVDGNDVSIENEWSATMMANATRDPLWRAKFATEILRNSQHEDVLNDKCTRCHAPMANQESVFDGVAPQFFGDGGFADPANFPIHDAAMDGVSCTLCHQIANDPTLGTPEGESGHYVIEDLVGFDRPAYGPYTNPRINPMQMNSLFTPQHSAHVSDSTLCGTCHNLKTPVLDAEGQIVEGAEFPEQMVYSEWENSAFADGGAEASSCQECHMARAEGAVKIANRPRNLGTRNNFARHGFYGGNTLMLDILGSNRAALDVGNGDFAAAIAATRATLASAADILIEEAVIEPAPTGGDELVVRVGVNNNSGHKLPTSYPSRRVYLHLTVTDQDGITRFESGAINQDGSIVGVDADTAPPTAPRYEPHYGADLDPDTNEVIPITSEDQVQVYEAIMEDSSGNQTYTLLNAARYSKDNRILPRGFDKNQPIGSAIAVLGKATDDGDFVAGSDLVTYRIALPNGTTGVTIAAELNYQTLAYGFLLDLLQDEAVPEVASFRDMYNASSVRAETIATATAQVGVPGGNEPPTASFSVSCTDLACTFDGTASIDTDGTIVSYVWDFDDAATATGTTAYHTYAAAGTYSATLTVTDDLGATDSATQAVTVTAPAGGGGPGPGPGPGGPRRGR